MNKALKKGKLTKYCGSRFYKKYCRNNILSFVEWLGFQDKRIQNHILGKDKAKLFRVGGSYGLADTIESQL